MRGELWRDGGDVGKQRASAEPEVVKHALHGGVIAAAARVGHHHWDQAA
jgi:hypothetical protein